MKRINKTENSVRKFKRSDVQVLGASLAGLLALHCAAVKAEGSGQTTTNGRADGG